jgi:hypothetical protein
MTNNQIKNLTMETLTYPKIKNQTNKAISFTFGLIILSQLTFGQAPADFSGVWELNNEKSSAMFSGILSTMIITQDNNASLINIDITSTTLKDQTTKRINKKYDLSGNSVIVGGSKETNTSIFAKWSTDKQNFIVTEKLSRESNGKKSESTRTSIYFLENTGKTLKVKISDVLPKGSKIQDQDKELLMVFDKAN